MLEPQTAAVAGTPISLSAAGTAPFIPQRGALCPLMEIGAYLAKVPETIERHGMVRQGKAGPDHEVGAYVQGKLRAPGVERITHAVTLGREAHGNGVAVHRIGDPVRLEDRDPLPEKIHYLAIAVEGNIAAVLICGRGDLKRQVAPQGESHDHDDSLQDGKGASSR